MRHDCSLLFNSVKLGSLLSNASSLLSKYAVLGKLATSLHSAFTLESILLNESLILLGSICKIKCLMVSSAWFKVELLSSNDLVNMTLNASIFSVSSAMASLNFRLRKSSIPLQIEQIFDG